MGSTRTPGPLGREGDLVTTPARNRVPLGVNDSAFGRVPVLVGDTPGPTGVNDTGAAKPFHPAILAQNSLQSAGEPAGPKAPVIPPMLPPGDATYTQDIALFSSYLIRSGYIRQVEGILPPTWRAMSEESLTKFLSDHYTEAEIRQKFLEAYTERSAIKATFRKANIVAALVIGLVWARENIRHGEWAEAAAKVTGPLFAAFVLKRLLAMRDPTMAEIMARRAGLFGRWLQGAARSNKFVSFLAKDLARGLLIWDLRTIFMSGGYGGPNIPFDLITEIDIDDPRTWHEPDQTLLDFGFSIWFQQKCTPNHPEACGTPVYLGRVEGSAVMGILKVLDIAPSDIPSIRNRLYRIEGDWDEIDLFIVTISRRRVTANENVLVLATGKRSGELISGHGQFHSLEVIPANEAAVNLFGGKNPRFVPEYLLKRYEP